MSVWRKELVDTRQSKGKRLMKRISDENLFLQGFSNIVDWSDRSTGVFVPGSSVQTTAMSKKKPGASAYWLLL